MQVNFEELKALVEAGDKSAFEQHIYKSLEKGDVLTAVTTNAAVKSELDSEKDKHHNTALETWKNNHLQGLIDDAVQKANPQETPEQKRIRELEEKIANSEKNEKLSTLKAKALEHATTKGLPTKFATKYIERFLGEDETLTASTLDELKTDLDEIVKTQVEETLKGNARGVGGGTGGNATESYGTKLAKQEGNTEVVKNAEQVWFG
jgi:Domain of unknown function (DUF4355)